VLFRSIKCVSVRFENTFGHRPLVQLTALSTGITRMWAKGVGIVGLEVCVVGRNISSAVVSYVAYDRVPGPGGVSDHVTVPGATKWCDWSSLPRRIASAAVVALTLESDGIIGSVATAPSSWLLESNTTGFRYCVDNPFNASAQLNWIAFGSEYKPPPRDPTPSSCGEARRLQWLNSAGNTGSGEYRLRTGNEDGNMYMTVFCDMGLDGSGWMLVGNVAAGDPFLPSLGQGPDALSPAASHTPLLYSSSFWNHNSSYWINHPAAVASSRILFMTGDRQVLCMLDLQQVRQFHRIGEKPSTPVLVSQNTGLKAGGLTSLTNEPESRGSRMLIACEGDFPQNMKKVLWAHSPARDWSCFKDSHMGVGVFVQ